MKKLVLLLFVLAGAANMIFAQPAGYYNNASGKYGTQLKSALHSIVRNHVRYPYTSSSTDTWDILKQTDKDTTNSANVTLLYTGWTKDGEDEYAGGSGWNREHVWPNSHGFPNQGDTAYTDVHHLRPSDISVNSARGNKDFDNGGTQYIDGDGPTNCYRDSDSWEPRPEVKGDVARMIFYMATRYEGSYDLELVDYTNTPNNPILGKLSTLLEWNRQDPPDDFERNRNDVIYSYQQNRNPFIDHPEYVDRIYYPGEFVINYAEHFSENRIVVYFNEPVDVATASVLENYMLDRGVNNPYAVITGFNENPNAVALLFADLQPLTTYNISVSNVKSSTNDEIVEGSLATFTTDEVVPVELVSFSASVSGNVVTLNWKTATETNNNGFDIERKTKSVWEKIGFVSGNGTTSEISEYSFVDNTPATDVAYRLKQTDYDGSFVYSKTVEVTVVPSEFELAQNYPNPFNPSTTISYTLPEESHVVLKVYDVLGNTISTLVNENIEAGAHQVKFNADGLNSGIYFYSIHSENAVITKKMIVLK